MPAPTADVVTPEIGGAPTGSEATVQAVVPTDAVVLPTITPEAPAENRLAEADRLHRYGQYAQAQTTLAALFRDVALSREQRIEGRLLLARTQLAAAQPEGALVSIRAALDEFDAQPPTAADLAAQRLTRTHFLHAEVLFQLARYSEAVDAYQASADLAPALLQTVQVRMALAYLALGDLAQALSSFRGALSTLNALPDSTLDQVLLLETVAELLHADGQYQAAAATYDEILAIAQNPGYRTQMLSAAAESYRLAGDEATAIVRWRSALEEAPEHALAYAALIELVNRNQEVDPYLRGLIDLNAGAWYPAIEAYQTFLAGADRADARLGWAMLGIGQAQLAVQQTVAAMGAFDAVITQYPDCTCFGQAWLDKARVQVAQSEPNAARRTLRTFARQYPQDELAPEALRRSALSALEEGNETEAALDFLTLAESFPESELAPLGLYVVAIGALQNGMTGEAEALFLRLQDHYPDYRWDAVAYWYGRAAIANGNEEAADRGWRDLVDRAPDRYYALLAARALQRVAPVGGGLMTDMARIAGPRSTLLDDDGSRAFAEAWLAAWIEVDVDSVRQVPQAVAQDPDFLAGAILLAVDDRAGAISRLDRVYGRFNADAHALYALTLAFAELEVYRLSLQSAARLLHLSPTERIEEAPLFLQQLLYPRPFSELIEQEAGANGLDPLLYYSLIRQESLFEEGARSVAAAQGLAQIIPDTAQWVADRLGVTDFNNQDTYLPYVNLRFGAYYLNWARTYLDGNTISALVGYNAGPGNAERWRELYGADDAIYVELLEYSEPRIYIQTISANLYHYTRLYGPQ